LPYQIFPGIFSSLDSYQKKVIHQYIDRNEKLPQWLSTLGEIQGYKPCPSSRKFRVLDKDTNILLTGRWMIYFFYRTGRILSWIIRLPNSQKIRMPYYPYTPFNSMGMPILQSVQAFLRYLNWYWYIWNLLPTEEEASRDEYFTTDGYLMKFMPQIHPIPLDESQLHPLLHKVRELCDLAQPPEGREGCENCRLVDKLVRVINQ
jgi:hypothetical protein